MPPIELARQLAALERIGLRRATPQAFDKAVREDRDSWRVTSGRPALGSFVDLTVVDRSADRASESVALAFAELERLRALFDRHDSASALSALNAAGRLSDVPRELTTLLTQSRRFSVASDGAFDVTVAPLLDLFRSAHGGREPSDREVAERRALVGFHGLALEKRRVAFGREGMSVTLDAIAKGAIVDAMARVLERHGMRRWLVNAGGDIRASNGGGDEPWTVAVRDPASAGTLPGAIRLRGGALATSGCYDAARAGGGQPREIVHGALGEFPQECASVTALAPSAMAADALATTVVALGPRAGLALIERLRCACLIVLADGSRMSSGTWKETTS